ncbi:MAG: 50S ribosomal protein L24 [Methanothrix sp.]|nr:MAG: 50S ribosomal protein L24 [Methanothrix sp.]
MKSKQPRKQRKERFNAPIHQRQKHMHATLSKELREEMNRRSAQVRRGDTAKGVRGDHGGSEGEVESADLKVGTIAVTSVSVFRADGTEVPRQIHPSNVIITKLELDDERRKEIFSR